MEDINTKMARMEEKVNNLEVNNSKEHKALFKKLNEMDQKLTPRWRVELLEKVVYGGLGIILVSVLYRFLELIKL